MSKAILYLEDGTSFLGRALDVLGETSGEVVFNTAMTGYQEILTDPSYAGQMVVMTYPLIGNYGVNLQDIESAGIYLKGFIVKEFSRTYSNFRATQGLIEYLNENNIMAIEGIDTRALTRHLRIKGAMRGIISTQDFDCKHLQEKMTKVPSMEGSDWVKKVTTQEKYIWKEEVDSQAFNNLRIKGLKSSRQIYTVAVMDCGVKYNILRILKSLGCEVHVFPAQATVKEIQAINPDGIFVSNGPGDPSAVPYVAETIKQFLGKLPIFGICLGHQILGLALGGQTYKLKFGHHGANHPVKDLLNGKIGITSQNHGFCIDEKSFQVEDIEVIHVNLNDQTVEGLRHKTQPVISFQHHPEAAPGPQDVQYLFKHFIEMMEKNA